MRKEGIVVILLIFCIGLSAAMDYQLIASRTLKTGDTWSNISGISGSSIRLDKVLSPTKISTTLTTYSSAPLNLSLGVIFQYNVNGYVFNVTSIIQGSNYGGSATINILKKICTPDWQCTSWGKCINGGQWRNCTDFNKCGVATGMPHESQPCATCVPSWMCTMWSECINNQQTRSCTDIHNCKMKSPPEIIACESGSADQETTDANDPSNSDESNNSDESDTSDDNGECDESWRCSDWSQCANNQQTRSCSDLSNCGTFNELPWMIRVCNIGNPDSNTNNPSAQNTQIPPTPQNLGQQSSGQGYYFPINFTFDYGLPDLTNINIDISHYFGPKYWPWWILLLLLYIYISMTYTFIGKRAKAYHYGIAWVPLVGPLLVSSRAAQMDSWPIWLLFVIALSSIAELIISFTPLALFSFALIYLNYALFITFYVYFIIWTWKMFSAVKRPGWWSLVNILPVLGWAVFLVFLGIAAWGHFEEVSVKEKKSRKKHS